MTHHTQKGVNTPSLARSYYSSVICWWIGLLFMAQAATEGLALLTSGEFFARLSVLCAHHFLVLPSRWLYCFLCAIAGLIVWLACYHYSQIVHRSRPRKPNTTFICVSTIVVLGFLALALAFHTAFLSLTALWIQASIIIS